MRSLLLFPALLAHSVLALAINLTPHKIDGGDIPAGHDEVVFTTSNGNWTKTLTLPSTGRDGATIKIVVKSSYSVKVLTTNTELADTLTLDTGETALFRYSATRDLWEIDCPTVTGSNQALNVHMGRNKFMRAKLSDTGWAPQIVLPAQADNGATVFATSTASQASRIDPANLQFPYTAPLRSGDKYTFTYLAKTKKWLMVKGPVTRLSAKDIVPDAPLPKPVTAVTRLELPASSEATQIVLPTSANDRDQLVIQSDASQRSTIEVKNQSLGTLTVGDGENYKFMWDADLKQWTLLRAPTRTFKAGALPTKGVVPTPETPVTTVEAWNGNVADPLMLPATAKVNDRVVVRSAASTSFQVTASGLATQTLTPGEEVAFVYGANKVWSRETDTLRLLLVSSEGAVKKLGTEGAKARQLESLRKMNEALANSGATFRFQTAGFVTWPDLGASLKKSLGTLRKSEEIKAERKQANATAVYYEGVEEGCGLAYVNRGASKAFMFASGSLNCSTDVMRHELGHTMGLGHGNGVADTVMSGNDLPYFATPKRYARNLLNLGHSADVPDEVSVMNKNADRLTLAK